MTEPLCPRARDPQQEKPPLMGSPRPATKSSPCSLQLEKSLYSNENPAQRKINKIKKPKQQQQNQPHGTEIF